MASAMLLVACSSSTSKSGQPSPKSSHASHAPISYAGLVPAGDLTGNGGYVRSIAFSPDGKTLAAGSGGGSAILWDLATKTKLATLTTPNDGLTTVAFSPDGKMLAAGDFDGTVWLWDVATRHLKATLPGHGAECHQIAFSPDGRTLASCGTTTARLWDVATGKVIATFASPSDQVHSLAFSPDGKTLAEAGAGPACLWDLATGRLLGTLDSPDNLGLAFSPDGIAVAVAGDSVSLWNVKTRTLIRDFPVDPETVGTAENLVFSPDGNTIAAGDLSAKVILGDVATGAEITTGASISGAAVAFSPDGRTLAAGTLADEEIHLWSVGA